MNKRILALSMAVMLFLLYLPIPAYAYGDGEQQAGAESVTLDSEDEEPLPASAEEIPQSPAWPDHSGTEITTAPQEDDPTELSEAQEGEPTEPTPTNAPFADNQTPPDESPEPVVVWGVLPLDALHVIPLEVGGDVSTLPLETTAYAQYARFKFVECTIHWRYDDFDASTPGRRPIIGDVMLPDGYIYPDDELTVEYEVLVYDPQAPTEIIVAANFFSTPSKSVLHLGMSGEELEQYFRQNTDATVELSTAAGDFFLCELTYDLSLIDTGNVGSYYPFLYELPLYAAFSGNEAMLTAAHVIDPDTVDLRGAYYAPNVGLIICSWFKEIAEPELWVSVDEGEWQSCPDYGHFSRGATLMATQVVIDTSSLPAGHVYEFEVHYENDGYSVNSLCVDMTGDIPELRLRDGDRHGYDRGSGEGEDSEDGTSTGNGNNGGTPAGNDGNGTGGNGDDGQPAPGNNDGDGNNGGTPVGNGGDETGGDGDGDDGQPAPGNSDGDGDNGGTSVGNGGNGTGGDGDGDDGQPAPGNSDGDGDNGGTPVGDGGNGTGGNATPIPSGNGDSGTGNRDTDKTVQSNDEHTAPSKADQELEKTSAQLPPSDIPMSDLVASATAVQAQETNTPQPWAGSVAEDDALPMQITADTPVTPASPESFGRLDEQAPRAKPLPTAVPMVIGGAVIAAFAALTLTGKRRVMK